MFLLFGAGCYDCLKSVMVAGGPFLAEQQEEHRFGLAVVECKNEQWHISSKLLDNMCDKMRDFVDVLRMMEDSQKLLL